MFCSECGKELPEGALFCTGCGATQTPAQAAPVPTDVPTDVPPAEYDKKGRIIPNPLRAPAGLTKKEFFAEYSKTRSNIIASAVIGYIAAGITLILTLALSNWLSLLDVVILLAMSLLVHLKQSRICAIVLLAYSAVNCIIGLVTTGQFSGWLIIIAGICAVIGAFAFQKEWKAYQLRFSAQES